MGKIMKLNPNLIRILCGCFLWGQGTHFQIFQRMAKLENFNFFKFREAAHCLEKFLSWNGIPNLLKGKRNESIEEPTVGGAIVR